MKRLLPMLLMSAVITVPNMALGTPISSSLVLSQQDGQENITQKIQVAFPNFVVVSLKSGNMTTGNFIDFNNRSLIISFKGYTTGIPLNEIKAIEFKDKVLIPENETVICQQTNSQCRQVAFTPNQEQELIIFENIPVTNLSLFQGAKTALLTISDTSEEEEGENINDLSNENINIINFLEMDESGELITITLVTIKR